MLVPSRHHFCFPEPMGQKSHWRSLLHLLTILVFLGKWNKRDEADRFLCPGTALVHPGWRGRWRGGSLSSGIGNACDSHPRPAAAKAPQFCSRKRSAVHVPMQRIAFVIAARCIRHRSALRFSFHRGRGALGCVFRPCPEAAASLLGMHSDELGVGLRWGMGQGKTFPAIVWKNTAKSGSLGKKVGWMVGFITES